MGNNLKTVGSNKFQYLEQAEILPDLTKEYTLGITIQGLSPVLMVVSTDESANKPYRNAMQQHFIGSNLSKKSVNQQNIELTNFDRTAYPQYVIKGWKNIVDAEGNEVPFSVNDCLDFIEMLPKYEFNGLRSFCLDPSNFVATIDIEVTAKK